MGAGFGMWDEGAFVNNASIRWNSLDYIGYTKRGKHYYNPIVGAISVFDIIESISLLNNHKGQRPNDNVFISENTVLRTPFAGIFVAHTKNAYICKNSLLGVNNWDNYNAGKAYGYTAYYGMVFNDCTNIQSYQNTIWKGNYSIATLNQTSVDNYNASTVNVC